MSLKDALPELRSPFWYANQDQKSRDYSNIMNSYRPGHADYTFDAKYGFRDYRGGGRSSGRETIGRVAAGAVHVRFWNLLASRLWLTPSPSGPVSIRNRI